MESILSRQSPSDIVTTDRREFLKNAGKGLMGAGVLSSLPLASAEAHNNLPMAAEVSQIKFPPTNDPSERPMGEVPTPEIPSKRIGYAVVGLGRLSLYHILPALAHSKYSKPVALVSGDNEKAKNVAAQYGIAEKNIYSYQSFDEIKNNPEIEAVYIVLPNSQHEEFTIRAANAGKHVLCEKPMATSSAAAKKMIEACKKANKKLMIAYRIQYEPNNRQIKKWVREKKYGAVKVLDLMNTQNIGDPSQWRLKKSLSGGGSLVDIGIYTINTSRFLLGEEPEKIAASIYTTPNDPRFSEVEETVMFQLFFPGGAVSNNTCSYGVHESRYYRCHSDKGATFGMSTAFSYGELRMELSKADDKLEMKSVPTMEEKDQFILEIDHFSDCIKTGNTPYTPGEEGLQDLVIIEAIYESARKGQAVTLTPVKKTDAFRGSEPKN